MNYAGYNPILLVNYQHPLNQKRVGWWLTIPSLSSSRKFINLFNIPGTHGNFTNGIKWSGSGRQGNNIALSFNGVDQYINFSDNTNFEFASGQGFTFAFWMKAVANTTQSGLLTKGYDSIFSINDIPLYLIRWNVGGTPGAIDFFLRDGSGTSVAATITGITDNLWHYITCVYNPVDGSATIYLDGVAGSPVSLTPDAYGTNTSPLIMGTHAGGFYPGMFDDLGIWKRSLSSAEIWQLYSLSKIGYMGLLSECMSRIWSFSISVTNPALRFSGFPTPLLSM